MKNENAISTAPIGMMTRGAHRCSASGPSMAPTMPPAIMRSDSVPKMMDALHPELVAHGDVEDSRGEGGPHRRRRSPAWLPQPPATSRRTSAGRLWSLERSWSSGGIGCLWPSVTDMPAMALPRACCARLARADTVVLTPSCRLRVAGGGRGKFSEQFKS